MDEYEQYQVDLRKGKKLSSNLEENPIEGVGIVGDGGDEVPVYATFWRRLLALMMDLLMIITIFGGFINLWLYFKRGQTIGYKFVGLKIVNSEGKVPSFLKLLWRFTLKVLFFWLLYLLCDLLLGSYRSELFSDFLVNFFEIHESASWGDLLYFTLLFFVLFFFKNDKEQRLYDLNLDVFVVDYKQRSSGTIFVLNLLFPVLAYIILTILFVAFAMFVMSFWMFF